ncbi:MAG: histidinol dehydrogenase [Marinicellaceae bacterium]
MFIKAKDFIRPTISNLQTVEGTVKTILDDIKTHGDKSVNHWSNKIDGCHAKIIPLLAFDDYELDTELAEAIKFAHKRIKVFSEFQSKDLTNDHYTDDIGDFGYIYQPIERIGAYIPGGRFPLISTALMTLTPAQVAGCPVRIACSPSDHPALLAAASLAGATEFLHLGGAQAIGALSYGFKHIEPVNMIVGPGNAYVNAAKAQVQAHTKIDTLAGPSELMIYANTLKNTEWIMYDALAQAEHDTDAVSIVVSTSKQLLENLYTCTNAHESGIELIQNNQIQFILADNNEQAITIINDYAPEHLLITDAKIDSKLFSNYGSLFIGENSAVAFGDYCAGPNHTLPTNGAGKNSGGLSVHQFLKVLSTQKINDAGRKKLSKTSAVLAQAEGLVFHQESAIVRG